MSDYRNICSEIFAQHSDAENYKCGIGRKGLFEQIKQNRRFYKGDQWYGAKLGSDKPLVSHNVIRRIGDYKTAIVGGEKIDVSFTPVGIASVSQKDAVKYLETEIIGNSKKNFGKLTDEEILLASKAISQYFNNCLNRLHFEDVCISALKNAYITGTGVVYAYWDCSVKTGLFADDKRTVPIMGDICAEVIDIENVDFSDPANGSVEEQEYIIISSRKPVGELIREAKRNGVSREEIEKIKPDNIYCDDEAFYSEKATVLTKFYKEYKSDGDCTVKAIRVCRDAVIKPEWDTKLKIYPIAKFNWEDENCAYGSSEITNIIPNQIAINRMLTATVWSVMLMGMPIMLVNGDIITEPITNNPGQIISFCGNSEDFERAIKYISPPVFLGNIDEITNKLIENTLNAAGATDAALGTIKAQNTSAINAVKEMARLPLNSIKKRYISFTEDIANIFLQFMLNMYGTRPIAQKNRKGDTWYFPFEAERYKNLCFICESSITDVVDEINLLADELDSLDNASKHQLADTLINSENEVKSV